MTQKLCDELSRQLPIEVLPPVATSRQVAAVIGTSEAALSQERYQHKGIPYTKIGRRVRYLRSDVIEFLAANRVEGAA
ncbi:helix-turn-helix domain-containing protein [Mycobacterium sp. Root265]|uniref:helix-turn-helix domain-containing protein n=1 Tax=Mycobacterium sp. Root265 TaxID=1736504 RepID=UPI001F1ED784|nr:helix-turn-helix domain-containing protein [Mycobacterium sp. Root265]